MFGKLLSVAFPQVCVVCNKPVPQNRYVCEGCEQGLHYIGRNSGCKTCFSPVIPGDIHCGRCILRPPKYDRLISCVVYKDAVRTTIHRYKFRNRPDLHTSFSAMLIQRLEETGCTDFDVVVPIPLSKERYAERGYNQAGLIAKDIAAHFRVLYNKEVLFRKRHTGRQSELSYQYREANVRGAFAINKTDCLKDKHVLLIDDIFTTGATMREAARMLSKTGCRITAATIAAVYNSSIQPED